MKPPTIKQCRFCKASDNGMPCTMKVRWLCCSKTWRTPIGLIDTWQSQCLDWHSGGLLPEVYVDAS